MVCQSVILAAGHGTRMNSKLPKVLHHLAGRPMLVWVAEACRQSTGRPPVIVVGPEDAEIQQAVPDARWARQEERLGTGHALRQAEGAAGEEPNCILVVNGDMPLLSAATLTRLVETQEANSGPLSLLTVETDDPRGFGRILRDARGRVSGVVEQAHATPEQLESRELNAGVYCFRADWLWSHLPGLELSPKGEYYATDLVGIAAQAGEPVVAVLGEDSAEFIGVNTRVHLAEAEEALRRRINTHWMEHGVTLQDPRTTYIEADAVLEPDSIVLANTHVEGRSHIGEGSLIGPNTVIRDTTIGPRCRVEASVLEGAELAEEVHIGPFGHLREGAHLGPRVHLGNFGEVKNSTLKAGVKMGHFSYIGDANVGADVNIGAGTITCNFDGVKKNKTDIGEGAFIGSDTMLVAPLRVGKGSRTGAGSVVTKDVPDHALAVGMPARVVRRLKDTDG